MRTYTNMEILKIAMENKNEIDSIARHLYITMPWNFNTSLKRTMDVILGFNNNLNLDGNDDAADNLLYIIRNMTTDYNDGLVKELINEMKCKGTDLNIKKRIRKLWRMINRKKAIGTFNFYRTVYKPKIVSFETLRESYRCDDSKNKLKQDFLNYIYYTDIEKKKQSKRYTISRDLDKDAYYETVEGRLAKIKRNQLNKYIKSGDISDCLKAKKEIPEGIYVKPMKLINKALPKIQESYKLLLASLFEGIKECRMVIDEDFETAYEPSYCSHQDTDGDKASNYSCMSGEGERAQNFYGLIHGCKVVRWELEDGEQIGRCIMYEWNGRRHFIRIYGRYEYHRTMINMLEAQMKEGDIFGRNCKLDGIKLATDLDWDSCVMYLDGNRYGLKEKNGTWYMVADKYDCDCKVTGGDTLESLMEETSTCEHCGRRYNSDDGIWINDGFYCCHECAEADGWHLCERCGEWVHEDDAIWVEGVGYYCCDICARQNGYEYDSYYNEWTDEELGNTEDEEYYTTRGGAAAYYQVDEDKVEWNSERNYWENTAKEENKEQKTEGEEND